MDCRAGKHLEVRGSQPRSVYFKTRQGYKFNFCGRSYATLKLFSDCRSDQPPPPLRLSLCAFNVIHVHYLRFLVTAAVIIFLLIGQVACGPVKSTAKALSDTIKLMQTEIRTALEALAEPGVLPSSTSCHSLNTSELGGSGPLTTEHLPLFRCYMMKMSNLTMDVSHELVTVSQYSQDVEWLTSNNTDSRDCKLPAFEQEMDSFVYVKCLLEHFQQQLSNTTLGF